MNHHDSAPAPAWSAFHSGDYQKVIELLGPLSGSTDFNNEDRTMFGLALMRSGELAQAHVHLERAALLGNEESAVEYANLLRSVGQTQKAADQLSVLLPTLSGELRLRAMRWLGVCEDLLNIPTGLPRVEEARLGYIALGDAELGARITQTLAAMYSLRGQPQKARQMLDAALPVLEAQKNRRPFLSALCTLSDLLMEARLYVDASDTIEQALLIAREIGDAYNGTRLQHLKAVLALLRGDVGQFLPAVHQAVDEAARNSDAAMLELNLVLLADHHSRMGEHEQAISVLSSLYQQVPEPGLNTATVEAMLARRRGDLRGAYRRLMELRDLADTQGRRVESARAWLQAVYTLYLMHDYDAVKRQLPEVLSSLLRHGLPGGPMLLRSDFDELSELLSYARLDPDSAPILASVLDNASDLLGAQADLLAASSTLELITLGQLRMVQNGTVVGYAGKRSVVPLLTYVTLHPNTTKRQIQADLYSEKSPTASSASIQRVLRDVHNQLGSVLIQEGSYHEPTYRISPKVTVSLDVQLVMQRLTQDNVVGALAAFKGEFLAGVEDSQWAEDIRDRIRESLRAALTPLLLEAEMSGDHRRVVLLCNEGLRVIVSDSALLERRVIAAEKGCGPVELAKYRSEYRQALN